jgi:Ca2+-binding RTX toxin-like protein
MTNQIPGHSSAAAHDWRATSARPAPEALEEVYYLTGVNSDGTIRKHSYWGAFGETAHKWGPPTAGTGATVTYSFEGASSFTTTEMDTFRMAFALWAAVANVTFTEVASSGNILLQRGVPGSGAYADAKFDPGQGQTLGSHTGSTILNMDTTIRGFDLSGSFQIDGGYGLSTAIHEIGHVLGLGHGGAYNGEVKPNKQQESAYDTLQWTLMSYIGPQDETAKYFADYKTPGTIWGGSTAHTVMPLDIVAIQQLYGAPSTSVLAGRQTFGFNSNILGLVGRYFDFTDNSKPVVTLFSTGTNNTLDVSGFSEDAAINLRDGAFSSAGGLVNNIGIAFGTVVETAITGLGNDTIVGNAFANTLIGGGGGDTLHGGFAKDVLSGDAGNDLLHGGHGSDTLTGGRGPDSRDGFVFDARLRKNVDTVVDFERKHDQILLDHLIFKALGGGTHLHKGMFTANKEGVATAWGTAQIVYETSTGNLFYDADGAGRKEAVLFAVLDHMPKLSINDFDIV